MVVVVVVVQEVGIGRGHSITRWQVRCPFKEWARFMGGANRECQVGGRAGGRSGAGGGWANVKVGNAGGACRSGTWATEEGGQK